MMKHHEKGGAVDSVDYWMDKSQMIESILGSSSHAKFNYMDPDAIPGQLEQHLNDPTECNDGPEHLWRFLLFRSNEAHSR